MHGTYPEYHTSADNPSFVSTSQMVETLEAILEIIDRVDGRPSGDEHQPQPDPRPADLADPRNRTLTNLVPHGEPQLGRRGLYQAIGAVPDPGRSHLAMLWVLNQSDGTRSLADIAARSGIEFATIAAIADVLEFEGLLA